MVSITSSFTVVPSESTPKGTLWLSESDQMARLAHVPIIYVYTLQPNHSAIPNAIERMRDSLSNILVHFYPLAGRLRWIAGGRLEVDCNEAGVTLLEAKSPEKLNDYSDFRPKGNLRELVPRADYTKPIDEVPLLLVQLTKFRCGGVSIGISMSHAMADGFAAIYFINLWAKLSRGETLEQDDMPFLDRTILKRREPLTPSAPNQPVFMPVPVLLGASDSIAEERKDTTVELLKLTQEQVEKIKMKASKEIVIKDRPYSRYEAITAHIWKSASKARHNEYHQPTLVRILANIRNRLISNPPLPRNYFGNAIVPTFSTCHSGDIISNPLSYTAQRIREGIEILTDEYITSQRDFIASQPDVVSLRASFRAFLGTPNIHVVSWTSLPLYEADFGWGKPAYMGPGYLNEDGKMFILPTLVGYDSVIVVMRLQTAHVEDFKKFFYDDI